MLYGHFSNSWLSLEGGRGMPKLREGDRFLVDLVEADEVEMVWEGCRAAEVWRVSELRGMYGTRMREAAKSDGALERLVGRGNAGKARGEAGRRVAQVRGGREDVMGRVVRTGAGSRCNKSLGAWMGPSVSDWSLAASTADGVAMPGIPQSGPGSDHVECRRLARVEGQRAEEPGWCRAEGGSEAWWCTGEAGGHMGEKGKCMRCGAEEETTMHAIIECKAAGNIWREMDRKLDQMWGEHKLDWSGCTAGY
jgi:hypothetical protein